MKVKLLLATAMMAAITSNAFALHITKGKLLSHKEWATGGAIALTMPTNKTKASLMRMLDQQNSIQPSLVVAGIDNFATTVNEPVTINNNGFFWFENTTAASKTLSLMTSICVQHSVNTLECVYTFDRFDLEAGGYVELNIFPALKVAFREAGTYITTASSEFRSEEMDGGSIGVSHATGFITVA